MKVVLYGRSWHIRRPMGSQLNSSWLSARSVWMLSEGGTRSRSRRRWRRWRDGGLEESRSTGRDPALEGLILSSGGSLESRTD
jgi:hypothetical protein